MDDEQLRKRKAYFEGNQPLAFTLSNIAPIVKAMDALVAESVSLMYGEPYPRVEDLL